jgi:hypothetical protein
MSAFVVYTPPKNNSGKSVWTDATVAAMWRREFASAVKLEDRRARATACLEAIDSMDIETLLEWEIGGFGWAGNCSLGYTHL